MDRMIPLVIAALLLLFPFESHSQQTITVCENQTPGSIKCSLGKEIHIVTVLYGRTRALPISTCNPLNIQFTNMNCVGGIQAKNYVNTQCAGKSKCTVTNSYLILGDPCSGQPKFLKIDYQCIIPTLPPNTVRTTTPRVVTSPSHQTTVQTSTVSNVKTFRTTTLPPNQSQITICEQKSHTFSCAAGKVMRITHVLWGRVPPSQSTLCNPFNSNVTGANCAGRTAVAFVEGLCNGLPSCVVSNDYTKLGPDPCPGIPKYLQVSFQCDIPTTTSRTTTTLMSTNKSTTPTPQTTTTILTSSTPLPTMPQTTLPKGFKSALVCQPSQTIIRCPPGDEILIGTVFYGRTSQVPCNPSHQSFSNINCVGGPSSNVTVHVYCDHQASCIVTAANAFLRVVDPCPGIPKYLQITYQCKQLAPPTQPSTSTSTPTTTSTITPTTTSTTTPTTPSTTTLTTTSTTTPTTTSTITPTTTSTTTPTTTSTTTPTTTSTITPTTTSTTTPTTTSTTTPTTTSTTTPTTTSTTTPITTSTTTSTTASTSTPTTTSTTTSTTPTTTTTTLTTTSSTATSTVTSTTQSSAGSTRSTTQMTTLPPYIPFHLPANAPQGAQVCHEYLVSGQHGVPDSHLTASSIWNSHLPNDNNGPDRSRLYTAAYDYGNGTFYRGAWTAGVNDKNQYIQVELMRPSLVRGIATQGRHLNPLTFCCVQRVTEYKVSRSNDGTTWDMLQDSNGGDMLFKGNIDEDSVVIHMFDCPFIARFIRIHPQSWHNRVALRFDAIGCQAITSDVGKCDPGWAELKGTNVCYLFSNTSVSWRDAKRTCLLDQGHLVDIQSIKERDFILQKISGSAVSMWWIGLSNIPRQDAKDYKWTDGKDLDTKILQWKKGQPDNGGYGEHCGEFWNKELNDDNCDLHRNFICEKDKYWKPRLNTPFISVKTPHTAASTKPTLPQTHQQSTTTTTPKPPPTVRIAIPTQPGVPFVSTGGHIFTTGCVSRPQDCYTRKEGNYQACKGCGHYVTCAVSGMWPRPCPFNLKWDDNSKVCDYRSSTCSGP